MAAKGAGTMPEGREGTGGRVSKAGPNPTNQPQLQTKPNKGKGVYRLLLFFSAHRMNPTC